MAGSDIFIHTLLSCLDRHLSSFSAALQLVLPVRIEKETSCLLWLLK